jgi:tetratricopeptide (TPR) repeat protein
MKTLAQTLALGLVLSFASALAVAKVGSGAGSAEDRRVEAARAEKDFVAANELALKGDLKAAIALYKTLLEEGVSHEDLDFNLGNAYAQDGQLAEAAVAYERALRLAPNDGDARANLDTLRKKMGASEKPPAGAPDQSQEQVAIADLVEPIVAPLPLALFTDLALGFDALLFASLLVRRRAARGSTQRRLSLLAVLALLGFLFSASIVAGHAVIAADPRAVVLEPSELKEGPHPRFRASGRVAAGARVRILSEESGFVRILKQDGTSGWVPAKSVLSV